MTRQTPQSNDRSFPLSYATEAPNAVRPPRGLAGQPAPAAARAGPPDQGPVPLPGAASFAGRPVDYGEFRAVPHLIEDMAGRHPGRAAACFGGRTLTYRQLDQFADGIAAEAAARGMSKGGRVATLL